MSDEYNPKQYFNNGGILKYGENLTKDQKERLKNGEVFTLLNQDGRPWKHVLMDSFDVIRSGVIGETNYIGVRVE